MKSMTQNHRATSVGTFSLNRIMRTVLVWLSTLALLCSSVGASWAQALAALDFDIAAPVITHQPLPRTNAGEALTISATIEDNVAVASAAVVYLTSSAQQYREQPMSPSGAANWQATIETSTDDTYVHYYIVAEDSEGNRVQKGAQTEPLAVELHDGGLLFLSGVVDNRQRAESDKPNMLFIALGVLAAGLLLSAGGGGGSDGGVVQSDDSCCTVTFTVDNASGN